jgi:thiol-disulfide isomerase/thioredoxin
MIGILVAVIVVLGVAVAADLLLSFAVIRRLAALQARIKSGAGSGSGGSPAIGHRIGDFQVDLITGGAFTRRDLAGSRVVVAFFMTGCEPCKKTVAELAELPAPLPFALYVLINGRHDDADVLSLAAKMPAGARVGRIAALEETIEAFGIDGYPTVLSIEDGAVTAAGLRFSNVLEPASAR